jgi:hypothetical protein
MKRTSKSQNTECKWRKDWPKAVGNYIVRLVNRDIISLVVRDYESDELGKCLDAEYDGDGRSTETNRKRP